MSAELFPELKQLIDEAVHPVVAVVVAEGCEQYTGLFLSDFEQRAYNQPNPIHFHVICYPENQMVFPRPLTQAVYYFAPKNYTPLFWRHANKAMNVEVDIAAATKMAQGQQYLDATYNEDTKRQYEQTEEMIRTEDTSKFPSLFQQARNFAKEMWHSGKNAAHGLPILVDANIAFERFNICQSCEFLKTEQFRCEKCGCFMKTKTHLASASCPIGKWAAVAGQK
jgi:hypothetical protein